MKLPFVTIEYREEESHSAGTLSSTLMLGFGIQWTWILMVIFEGIGLIDSGGTKTGLTFLAPFFAVFACTFICYGMFLDRARALFITPADRRRNRLIGAVLASSGTLALSVASAGLPLPSVFLMLFGACAGVGSAVLVMSFAVSFSVCDAPTATTCFAISILICGLATATLMTLLRALPAAAFALGVAMPFVELVCLNSCSARLVDKLEFISSTIPARPLPFALHMLVPSFLFGLVAGIARFRMMAFWSQLDVAHVTLSIVGAAAIVSIVTMSAMLSQRHNSNFMIRTMLPVAAAFFIAMCFQEMDGAFIACALLSICLILDGCTWLFFADISQRFRISCFVVFGFGHGTFVAGSTAGFILSIPASELDWPLFGLLCMFLLISASSFIPNNAEIRNTLVIGRRCPAFIEDDAFDLAPTEPLAPYRAPLRVVRGEDEMIREAASAGSSANAMRGGTDDGARAASYPTIEGSRPAAHPTAADETPDGAGNDDGLSGRMGNRRYGRFKRKCAAVAERYLLTHKETEVLFLLAKGNNTAAIQENLYISAGTANTHMRHIYRKLNVHSQQELIDLVESENVEEA
ncbi:response regulator transcription factor [Slackia exigua]|uniref:helix-turn-helix transcriptional regulator n=1 Tax=Slackia exigua TaxID=84109 RepID=UPI003AB994A9